MPPDFSRVLLFLICTALFGGVLAKIVKLQPFLGYIVAGIIVKWILPESFWGVEKIAELGLIFLLFSIGLELSISRLRRVFKVTTMGAGIQIILVTIISSIIMRLFGFSLIHSFILSLGFSLSSTAIIVKILADKVETDTLHGEIAIGWCLVQDLAVIPMMIMIQNFNSGIGSGLLLDIVKIFIALIVTILLSKYIVPKVMHKLSSFNSRELLVLGSVFFAIGIALIANYFGISPAIGAFIAGIVISDTDEKHEVFAEIRPLRDLFVGIFFVSLGFLVLPDALISNLGTIIFLTVIVLLVKFISVFIICLNLGYHGRTAVSVGLILSQIGEFSFILFSFSLTEGLISEKLLTIGISTTLFSLIIFPLFYKEKERLWEIIKKISVKYPFTERFILGRDRGISTEKLHMENHIIICGYGRVGRWVCRAIESINIPYLVIELNQTTVKSLRVLGVPVIYGDPTEKEILEVAGIKKAKAIIIAIPERFTQEAVIAEVQTIAPEVKIISRVHTDEEWERLKTLKLHKIVQPEFEAAIAIIRSILISMGKDTNEISRKLKSIRGIRTMSL